MIVVIHFYGEDFVLDCPKYTSSEDIREFLAIILGLPLRWIILLANHRAIRDDVPLVHHRAISDGDIKMYAMLNCNGDIYGCFRLQRWSPSANTRKIILL